jgi:hypothetical protein
MHTVEEYGAEEFLRPEDMPIRDMLEQMEEVNVLGGSTRQSLSTMFTGSVSDSFIVL